MNYLASNWNDRKSRIEILDRIRLRSQFRKMQSVSLKIGGFPVTSTVSGLDWARSFGLEVSGRDSLPVTVRKANRGI